MDNFDYDYFGYKIHTNDYGTYIGDMEFVSIEEAKEWVDDQRASASQTSVSSFPMRTYKVFFVAPKSDRYSSVEVNAKFVDDAIDWVETDYCPGAHVFDWSVLND